MTNQEQQDKQAFYGLYIGQKVLKASIDNPLSFARYTDTLPVTVNAETLRGNWFLELNNPANITDEDAIEVAKLCGYNNFHSKRGDSGGIAITVETTTKGDRKDTTIYINDKGVNILSNSGTWGGCNYERVNNIQVIDYLRSRGYLVPWRGMSCDEIIERGWAKLKGGDQ